MNHKNCIEIHRYQSVGNAFILMHVNVPCQQCFSELFDVSVSEIVTGKFPKYISGVERLCHRKVGADGVLLILPPAGGTPHRVLIFNSDGCYGAFSVNGARCSASYLLNRMAGYAKCELLVGKVPVQARRCSRHSSCYVVRAQCGAFVKPVALKVGERLVKGFFVNVGNPHFVVLQRIVKREFLELARVLEKGNLQTGGQVNVSFSWKSDFVTEEDELSFEGLVYERGAGFTLSCGSAFVALMHVLLYAGKLNYNSQICALMPGGRMRGRLLQDGFAEVCASVDKAFEVESGGCLL